MISNRQIFLDNLGQTTTMPLMLEIEKAEGVFLIDKNGKKYFDLISGISVSNVGHRHPKVVNAIKEQLDNYMHLMVYGEIIQAPQVQLAKAISGTLPETLNNVYFVNSGSEAVEGAIKLSKRYNGRPEIISFYNAYHGSTNGSLSLLGNEDMKRNFRPLLPGIKHIEFNNSDSLNEITPNTSAVIVEAIQGEAGIRMPETDFLKKLQKRCNKMGALLIIDEIQTGFGRTGKFWGFQNFGIIPDIIVTAKGMGGGMPLGAFISSRKIMQCLTDNPVLGHITTFGGHPVCCAASLATLQIINDPEFLIAVIEKGSLFKKLLIHPAIKEIRGIGLFMAIQLKSEESLKNSINKAIEKGLLIDWFLFCGDSIRLAPPLTISNEEIKEACEILIGCLE